MEAIGVRRSAVGAEQDLDAFLAMNAAERARAVDAATQRAVAATHILNDPGAPPVFRDMLATAILGAVDENGAPDLYAAGDMLDAARAARKAA